MSNVKHRFQKKTGIEYFDNAVELDREVWSFIKHEFKNKTKKETAKNPEMRDTPEGCIPYRYWDTHGKVLHKYAWELMRNVRLTYQISQPRSQKELEEKKRLREMDNLYFQLYGEYPVRKKKNKPKIIKFVKMSARKCKAIEAINKIRAEERKAA